MLGIDAKRAMHRYIVKSQDDEWIVEVFLLHLRNVEAEVCKEEDAKKVEDVAVQWG